MTRDLLTGTLALALALSLALYVWRAFSREMRDIQTARTRAHALAHDDDTTTYDAHTLSLWHDDDTHALAHDDAHDDAPVWATFHDATHGTAHDAPRDYDDAHDDIDAMPPHYA